MKRENVPKIVTNADKGGISFSETKYCLDVC